MKNNFRYGDFVFPNINFFREMLEMSDKLSQEGCNQAAGIERDEHGFYGVPNKGIPFAHAQLNFGKGHYLGEFFERIHVYSKDGLFLFSCFKFEYLEKDVFLVFDNEDAKYGAIYKHGKKLSDDIFSVGGLGGKFGEKSQFCQLLLRDKDWCIINTHGEIVFEDKSSFDYPHLYNNILWNKRAYYNLFNGEKICESYYSNTTINTGLWLFVQSDKEQVYKIDTLTGMFEVFGEAEKKPETKPVQKVETEKEPEPKIVKQNRNDLCACGSGNKFKNCCAIK